METAKYRVINASEKPIHFDWSLILLPAEVLEEFEDWRKSKDYYGYTDRQRILNRKRALGERIREFVHRKVNNGWKHPYGVWETVVDGNTQKYVEQYVFELPPAYTYREYIATLADSNMDGNVFIRKLAAEKKVDESRLLSWNKDNPIRPPYPGQKVKYFEIDMQKGVIVDGRQVEQFRGLVAQDIVQIRTKEEIALNMPQIMKSSNVYIYEAPDDVEFPTVDQSPEEQAAEENIQLMLIRAKYSDLIKAEIIKRLEQRGIEFDEKGKVDDLRELLVEDDIAGKV